MAVVSTAKTASVLWKFRKPITFLVVGFIGMIFLILAALFTIFQENQAPTSQAKLSEEVLQWKPLVEKYAKQYEVSGYVNMILALIQQESGGRHLDVMQASESLRLSPGTITDPERSIQVGVKEFSEVLQRANGKIKLALQSYNFGPGFIDYAMERGGYSPKVAQSFSDMMEKKLGWDSYGDPQYVQHVLRYWQTPKGVAGIPNEKGFIPPINSEISSHFGGRVDTITGDTGEFHEGTDFTCNGQTLPVFATRSGVVSRAGWQDPNNPNAGFGQRIYIKHGDGLVTIYAHLSKLFVQPGEKVNAGQPIGRCGTTGRSTGRHLHFQVQVKGRTMNPETVAF
jgi:murein DD-endopeptidase MepM/ murein hydrolase activator NlpD